MQFKAFCSVLLPCFVRFFCLALPSVSFSGRESMHSASCRQVISWSAFTFPLSLFPKGLFVNTHVFLKTGVGAISNEVRSHGFPVHPASAVLCKLLNLFWRIGPKQCYSLYNDLMKNFGTRVVPFASTNLVIIFNFSYIGVENLTSAIDLA